MNDLTIEVKTSTLLSRLKVNRAQHQREYDVALKGYYKLLRQELLDKLAVVDGQAGRARKGNQELSHIVNQKPVNYLAEYDEAIDMLSFAQNSVVELNSRQYQQYVKDEWNWSAVFSASNSAYAAAARKR